MSQVDVMLSEFASFIENKDGLAYVELPIRCENCHEPITGRMFNFARPAFCGLDCFDAYLKAL